MVFKRRREANACLIMLSTKQGSQWFHLNAFGMAQPGLEPTTSRSRSGCSTTEPAGPDLCDAARNSPIGHASTERDTRGQFINIRKVPKIGKVDTPKAKPKFFNTHV